MSSQSTVLEDTVPAHAACVVQLRGRLGRWLDEVLDLDSERRADVLLATEEALANCADHAYLDSEDAGMLTLRVRHQPPPSTLVIRVVDRGRWIEPPREMDPSSTRGRGLRLMRALADDVTIKGTAAGTVVDMTFAGCRAAG